MNRRNLLKLLFGGNIVPPITVLPEGKIYRSLRTDELYHIPINGKIGVGTITPNIKLKVNTNV